jgi:hypothetical protein
MGFARNNVSKTIGFDEFSKIGRSLTHLIKQIDYYIDNETHIVSELTRIETAVSKIK